MVSSSASSEIRLSGVLFSSWLVVCMHVLVAVREGGGQGDGGGLVWKSVVFRSVLSSSNKKNASHCACKMPRY